MMSSKAKRTLPKLIGGVEREYGIILPGLGGPKGSHKHVVQFLVDFSSLIEKEVDAWVGSINYLEEPSGAPIKYLLADGGCLGFEDINVIEAATPECMDTIPIIEYLHDYESFLAGALKRNGQLPPKLMLIKGPASLPHFGQGRHGFFNLGFHLNFSVKIPPSVGYELCTLLAALLPLISCGGLSKNGFCMSPIGSTALKSFALRSGPADHTYVLEQRLSPAYSETGERRSRCEHRLHLPALDCPLTRRMAAHIHSTCQLLLTLLLYGCSPLGGKRLAKPAGAYSAAARSEFSARFKLASGGMVDLYTIQETIYRNMVEIEKGFTLTQTQKYTLDALLRGLKAFRENDEDTLASLFDGYLKKKIYAKVLDAEGISLSFFNEIIAPVIYHASKLGCGLHELAQLSGKETARLIASPREDSSHKRRLQFLMKHHRIGTNDIPVFAQVIQRITTLELKLYQFGPDPSPLAEYEERIWRDFIDRSGIQPTSNQNRSSKRGEIIKLLSQKAAGRCRADWSGIYAFSDNKTIGVFSFPYPCRPVCSFSWVDLDEMDDSLYEDTGLKDRLEKTYEFYFGDKEGDEHEVCAAQEIIKYLPSILPKLDLDRGQLRLFGNR